MALGTRIASIIGEGYKNSRCFPAALEDRYLKLPESSKFNRKGM